MNQQLKENKQIIRQFMRDNYTDERLAMLLAHAQSGKLAYYTCCCFIGVATANHVLQGSRELPGYLGGGHGSHLDAARLLPGGNEAEDAFSELSDSEPWFDTWNGEQARRRLIPIIKAEIRRRDRERQAVHSEVMELSFVAR